MAASGSGKNQRNPKAQQKQQKQQKPSKVQVLVPLPAPGIYCFSQYTAHEPTSLIFRNRMITPGGSSKIFAVDGSLMFDVKGSFFTMSRRKEVFDNQGQHLFNVRVKFFRIPSLFYCETPDGTRFMDVRGQWSMTTPKSEALFINNADGKEVKIFSKNDFVHYHGELKLDNGHVVGRIDRNLWAARNLLLKRKYVLTIAPGMDIALCVAMCLAMDERLKRRGS